MKDFIYFINEDDIFNYIGSLWRTNIFKESHNNPDGYIYKIIKELAKTPRIFYDMHQETMEMVHFTTWFHAIQHRHYYINDTLHDLYYHHEFYHLLSMPYSKNYSLNEWATKMENNEFWASLESEALIYFYMPKLREISFKNEIWIDRFLNDSYYNGLYNNYFNFKNDLSEKLKSRIAFYRDECQFNSRDYIEKQISDYSISTNSWVEIWNQKENWKEVETQMVDYLFELKINPDIAIKKHITWLKHHQNNDSYNVAFGEQARAYSEIHRKLFKSSYLPKN